MIQSMVLCSQDWSLKTNKLCDLVFALRRRNPPSLKSGYLLLELANTFRFTDPSPQTVSRYCAKQSNCNLKHSKKIQLSPRILFTTVVLSSKTNDTKVPQAKCNQCSLLTDLQPNSGLPASPSHHGQAAIWFRVK